MLSCAVFGSEGKMGKIIIKELEKYKDKIKLVEGFTRLNKPSKQNTKGIDFIIDFSTPSASIALARIMENTGILIICGTTGFTESEMDELKSSKSKIVYSSNFSPTIRKIVEVLKDFASYYKDYEIEILERHHSLKKDAPSGTAIMMGAEMARARGQDFEKVKSIERNHKRKPGEIGFASLRQGNLSGLHEVFLTSSDEKIWIGHEAFNKNIFAVGAIEAGLKQYYALKDKKQGFFYF